MLSRARVCKPFGPDLRIFIWPFLLRAFNQHYLTTDLNVTSARQGICDQNPRQARGKVWILTSCGAADDTHRGLDKRLGGATRREEGVLLLTLIAARSWPAGHSQRLQASTVRRSFVLSCISDMISARNGYRNDLSDRRSAS